MRAAAAERRSKCARPNTHVLPSVGDVTLPGGELLPALRVVRLAPQRAPPGAGIHDPPSASAGWSPRRLRPGREDVLFTDIPNDRSSVLAGDRACVVAYSDTAKANGLTFDRENRLYVCEGGGRRIARYDADGSRVTLADRFAGKRLNEPNDIVVDDQGRIWFTDPCYGDRSIMELDHKFGVPGLDPGTDGAGRCRGYLRHHPSERPRILTRLSHPLCRRVAADRRRPASSGLSSLRRRLARRLSPAPRLRRPPRHRRHAGGPAGDIVATCGSKRSGPGPRIAIFSPTGQIIAEHPTPADPSNYTFGGSDFRTLYVTGFDGALQRAVTDRVGVRRP